MLQKNNGLTSSYAQEQVKQYGLNEIPEIKDSIGKKIVHLLISPISLMLLFAALLSYFTGKAFDCYFILFLLVLNIVIAVWQESKADNAIKKLNEHLTHQVKTLRDNHWRDLDSKLLVPQDCIELTLGDVIPADGKILEATNVTINESSLTGESLPKEKSTGDNVYSGSFIVTGLCKVLITATGKHTYFGKTLFSIEKSTKKSILEQDILTISKFLSILSIISVAILTIVFLLQKAPFIETLTLDLSLIIAGIPISLPTVMTLIIAFGVVELAKKKVVVRRLSSLEDLANVNLLLTDKTGTLTKNKITVQQAITYNSFTEKQLFQYAYASTLSTELSTIDAAIAEKATSLHCQSTAYKLHNLIPADSIRKRITTIFELNDITYTASVGAPQIINSLCSLSKTEQQKLEQDIQSLAEKGYRSVAVAIKNNASDEKNMQLVGLIALSDDVREDAKNVIEFLKENNIAVVMLTGDNKAIANEIAKKLHFQTEKILTKQDLEILGWSHLTKDTFLKTSAFAEILPDDKYQLVKIAKEYFIVATNGDGVNDLPAIKEAHVGFAVKNAVDALRATADIVLLSDGIDVIRDAIIEGRKIFSRIYSYSVYRISESLRLIITIVVLGLIYRIYPLTPLQLILVALLNDIPIISLAFDKVKNTNRPAKINVRERFTLSSLYGLVGVANSLILFFIMTKFLQLPWVVIQTMYFLKLTVSGHLLIYVARTKEPWFKFLPSKEVITATTITQLIATLLALTGFFMPAKIPLLYVLLVWLWAIIWMQVSEYIKILRR